VQRARVTDVLDDDCVLASAADSDVSAEQVESIAEVVARRVVAVLVHEGHHVGRIEDVQIRPVIVLKLIEVVLTSDSSLLSVTAHLSRHGSGVDGLLFPIVAIALVDSRRRPEIVALGGYCVRDGSGLHVGVDTVAKRTGIGHVGHEAVKVGANADAVLRRIRGGGVQRYPLRRVVGLDVRVTHRDEDVWIERCKLVA